VSRVVEHLLRHQADPSLRDHGGYTATHYAALSGHRLPLEMVIKHLYESCSLAQCNSV